MFFRKISPLIGSDNLDVASNRIGWERAGAIFSVVFSLLEAGVLLGLLKLAALSFNYNGLWLLFVCAYAATGIYVLTGSNYLLAMAYDRFELRDDKRWVKFTFKAITFAFAMAVPYFIGSLSSKVLVDALN